jgi:hypothetical protein
VELIRTFRQDEAKLMALGNALSRYGVFSLVNDNRPMSMGYLDDPGSAVLERDFPSKPEVPHKKWTRSGGSSRRGR